MTVIFSKKCELAIQSVLYFSVQEQGSLIGSKEIAENLKQPKDFISKVLQQLTVSGIIGSKKGKNGGFYLAKEPKDIKLIDIVKAIDGLDAFECCMLGFPGCSVSKPCPVHNQWGKVRENALQILTNETLEDLKTATQIKIESIK